MTEEERLSKIQQIINYWLPVRWTDGNNWWEIKSMNIVGTVESGGAELVVAKNDSECAVEFTNEELYGQAMLSVDAAKAKVMAV